MKPLQSRFAKIRSTSESAPRIAPGTAIFGDEEIPGVSIAISAAEKIYCRMEKR